MSKLTEEDRRRIVGKTKDAPFHLQSGSKIYSIKELVFSLRRMDDLTFHHHVHGIRNDFSNWVKHIFEDAELADRIHDIDDQKEMSNILEHRIQSLERMGKLESNVSKANKVSIGSKKLQTSSKIKKTSSKNKSSRKSKPKPKKRVKATLKKSNNFYYKKSAPKSKIHTEIVKVHHKIRDFHLNDFLVGLLIGLVIGMLLGMVI